MIKYDCRNVSKDVIGYDNGLDLVQEFADYKYKISEIINSIYENKDLRGEGKRWIFSGYDEDTLWYIKEFVSSVKDKYENLVVLGIGGSALGGLAVTNALLTPYWNLLSNEERKGYPRIFFIDNIDPDEINSLLNIIDLKKTLINVITKSGDTAEIMSVYMIIKDKMKKECDDNYRKSIVVTTDRSTGILRRLAEQEGYKNFEVPDDVGGRYSVFSSVGLLPFALLGINIDELLRGVREADTLLSNRSIYENIAAQNALIHYLLDKKKNKKINVLMPYSSKLKYVADWFSLLWAESLGKKYDLEGNEVFAGLTPIKALGVTDQHSQLQLYNDGPNDKIINFIRTENFATELQIPNLFDYTGLGYLSGKSIKTLLNAEAESMKLSLVDCNRPNVTFSIPEINEYYMGQLLYTLMMQTAITAALYNVNAFDQPGVEQSKDYTYGIMGRIGYEGSAQEFHEKMNRLYVNN